MNGNQRQKTNAQRPALPVCLLTTVRSDGGGPPDVICMRMSCPGLIERAFTVEDGRAAAVIHHEDRIESLSDLPTDATTVAHHIGEAATGALLVSWDTDATLADLAAYHPSPGAIVAHATLELDLRSVAVLAGAAAIDAPVTMDSLAEALAITPPGEGVRERGWFLARAVRRFVASGTWLARVCALGFDERTILETCAERLGAGSKTYGPWRLDQDDRDHAREAYEEVIDALHYAAAGLLRARDAAPKGAR